MGRIHAALLSYRRPDSLARSLRAVLASERRPDRMVVFDNEATARTEAVVREMLGTEPWVEYLPSARNLGPAGGRARAMRRLLEDAADDDWLLLLDDDDPLPQATTLDRIHAFAEARRASDPRMAGAALRGARFDRRRGYPVPVTTRGGRGPVAVDYLHGGFFPLFDVAAVRRVGVFMEELFFGWADLEFGLRLREAGNTLYVDLDLWREVAPAMGHAVELERPRARLGPSDARRYYVMRNWYHVLRRYGAPGSAARIFLLAGLAKPLLNVPVAPSLALDHLRLNVRARIDAARGRYGEATNRWSTGRPSEVEV